MVEAANADASHDEKGCAGESCSFFSCNSCTGFIFRIHNPQLEVYAFAQAEHFVPIEEDPTSRYCNSSWKPPRL